MDELINLARHVDNKIHQRDNEVNSVTKKKKKKKRKLNQEEPLTSEVKDECQPNKKKSSVPILTEEKNNEDESSLYPYPVDSNDHCETTSDAYQIICPCLDAIAKALNKTRENLFVFDPYFCEGSMVTQMNALGFMNVQNRKEDFYHNIETSQIPDYDVLITNPPYSGDHVERLMAYVMSTTKPFFLLMPNYVYAKPYYVNCTTSKSSIPSQVRSHNTQTMFYVVPSGRLAYTTPKGRRQAKSAKFTSPFPTFWYCSIGKLVSKVSVNMLRNIYSSVHGSNTSTSQNDCIFVTTTYQLPVTVLADGDPRKKKERNALKRKKNKNRKKQAVLSTSS